jgi:hypothetical protein
MDEIGVRMPTEQDVLNWFSNQAAVCLNHISEPWAEAWIGTSAQWAPR